MPARAELHPNQLGRTAAAELADDIPANVMPIDWYLHVRHAVGGRDRHVARDDGGPPSPRSRHGIPRTLTAESLGDTRPWMVATLEAMLDLVHGHRTSARGDRCRVRSACASRVSERHRPRVASLRFIVTTADDDAVAAVHRWAQNALAAAQRRLSTELVELGGLRTPPDGTSVGTAKVGRTKFLRRSGRDVTSADHMPRFDRSPCLVLMMEHADRPAAADSTTETLSNSLAAHLLRSAVTCRFRCPPSG